MALKFQYRAYAQEIIFGSGALGQLSQIIERYGWSRLLLCTSGSARRNGQAGQIESALGERVVAVYEGIQPHVPESQVAEALALAADKKIQAIISLGGGSPLGIAKAVSFLLEKQQTAGSPSANNLPPTAQPLFPVMAIPTTYAGSEMTATYGVTQQDGDITRKVTVNDPRIAPKLVLYDPQLTLDLPPELTASTGMNALAHCIEALYSITRNPLSSAAALEGLRHIAQALPRCYANGQDLEARTDMLVGAYLAGVALSNIAVGLHHGLCHVLGGSAGVPHGIANSIILPHAMRFNADVVAPHLLPAAEALGVAVNPADAQGTVFFAAEKVAALTAQMNLPQRLRAAGIAETDLPRLAQLAFKNHAVQNNPKPIRSAADLETLLRAAW